MTKVLLIDDDRKHSDLMQAYFKRFGINLICAYDSVEGFKKLARHEPDLLLLDIMLPGKDGFEICREVRKSSNIPIIMLTARGDVIDRVSGLELGADDYIGKPFEPRELVARVQAILRRSEIAGPSVGKLSFEGLTIEPETRSVTRRRQPGGPHVDGVRTSPDSRQASRAKTIPRRYPERTAWH